MNTLSTQMVVLICLLPKRIRLPGEMVDSTSEARNKLVLEHLTYQIEMKFSKTTSVGSEGLGSKPEASSTRQRWDSLSIVKNNCSELKYINEYNFTVGGLLVNQVIIMKTNKWKKESCFFSYMRYILLGTTR